MTTLVSLGGAGKLPNAGSPDGLVGDLGRITVGREAIQGLGYSLVVDGAASVCSSGTTATPRGSSTA
ncbi:MAG: hypothetical protein FJW96_10595 [Actinobacteria bacterium]|nr:hypothetical protein [Actinomycetota bacterium]